MSSRVTLKPFSKDKFELTKSYIYESKKGSILVPAGYITNGADIPRIFWSIYPPNSPAYLSAVVIHDYLCEKARKNKSYTLYKEADEIFYEHLLELEINRFQARLFYITCKFYHWSKKCLGIIK